MCMYVGTCVPVAITVHAIKLQYNVRYGYILYTNVSVLFYQLFASCRMLYFHCVSHCEIH